MMTGDVTYDGSFTTTVLTQNESQRVGDAARPIFLFPPASAVQAASVVFVRITRQTQQSAVNSHIYNRQITY